MSSEQQLPDAMDIHGTLPLWVSIDHVFINLHCKYETSAAVQKKETVNKDMQQWLWAFLRPNWPLCLVSGGLPLSNHVKSLNPWHDLILWEHYLELNGSPALKHAHITNVYPTHSMYGLESINLHPFG